MFDDFNFWDDRSLELYESENEHPCYGCNDFFDGECISNGGCASELVNKIKEVDDSYD